MSLYGNNKASNFFVFLLYLLTFQFQNLDFCINQNFKPIIFINKSNFVTFICSITCSNFSIFSNFKYFEAKFLKTVYVLQCVSNTTLHIYCYTLYAFKLIYFSQFL